MKRIYKNIICVILILLIGTGIYFTISYARKNVDSLQGNTEITGNPPQMENGSGNNMTPPDKPNGEANDNSNMTPPEKPDGENSNENMTPPEIPNENGNMQNPGENNQSSNTSIKTIYKVLISLEILIEVFLITFLIMSNFNEKTIKETFVNFDKILIYVLTSLIFTIIISFASIYFMSKNLNVNNSNNNQMGPGGNQNSNISYSAVKEITSNEDIEGVSIESTNKDENALLINGVSSNITNVTVTKTGDSDGGDNTSFYGTNSGILAKGGANVSITGGRVTTNATGANGVFSYGGSATTENSSSDGTTVNIKNTKIVTTKDNSGGIMTTGGGITNAENLTIETSGVSSAAIRSDRGGGTVTVNKGAYTTNGAGSPVIYSTANITVKNATLVSKASEGVVIEGKNSVTLENVNLTDTNNKLNGKSTTYKNIFLYQSMSGDASNGESTFTSKNSKITTNKGDTFFITNTTSTINIENNTFINNDKTGYFLKASTSDWGNSGSNGGIVTLNLTNQNVVGNIYIDEISTLKMNLSSSSYYEGYINKENIAKSISLILDKSSKIKLTGDTYVTSLENADTTNSNIDFNGYKLYVNGKSIN